MGQCASSPGKNQPKIDLAMIGYDDSGKTTLLYQLLQKKVDGEIPRTVGYNLEELKVKKTTINIWDIGGHSNIRGLWKYHYSGKNGIIFVIDSSKKDKIEQSIEEVDKLLREPEIMKNNILVVANKQDLAESVPCDVIEGKLKQTLNGRSSSVRVVPASALSDEGLAKLKTELADFIQKKK